LVDFCWIFLRDEIIRAAAPPAGPRQPPARSLQDPNESLFPFRHGFDCFLRHVAATGRRFTQQEDFGLAAPSLKF